MRIRFNTIGFLQGFLLSMIILIINKLFHFYVYNEPFTFNPSLELWLGYLIIMLLGGFGFMIIDNKK